jgi:PhnB protein
MKLQPYLFFEGRAEEAVEFYRSALGAEVVQMIRFGDSPEQPPAGSMPEDYERKVMHASLKIGESLLLLSDGGCSGASAFRGCSISLFAADTAEAERLFATLAEEGEVQMPLTRTFFSPAFGMLADRFGVPWMIVAER